MNGTLSDQNRGLHNNRYVLLAFYVGLVVAFGSSVIVYNAWRIFLNRHKYRPDVFVVDRVDYYPGDVGYVPMWTATGTIGGVRENFALMDSIAEPDDVNELRATFPVGTKIEVWYDPTATRTATQGRYLRVLPRHLNFDKALSNALVHTVCFDGLMVLAGLVIALSALKSKLSSLRDTEALGS